MLTVIKHKCVCANNVYKSHNREDTTTHRRVPRAKTRAHDILNIDAKASVESHTKKPVMKEGCWRSFLQLSDLQTTSKGPSRQLKPSCASTVQHPDFTIFLIFQCLLFYSLSISIYCSILSYIVTSYHLILSGLVYRQSSQQV